MTWQQLICHTSLDFQEVVSDVLDSVGAVSVTLEDAADQPVLEPLPGETPLWDQLIITGLYPASTDLTTLLLVLETKRAEWNLSHISLEALEDRPWVREWMDNFHPMRFGQRLWVYPSWRDIPSEAGVKILLDPGLAFGTGTHPTTALCLTWLDGADLVDKSVLDYGCGSGILAIAAAKLGATTVVATDIDPQALQATEDNAARNALDTIDIYTCMPNDLPERQYDVVLANILSGPLVQLAPKLLAQLKNNGYITLSGILAEQEAQVRQAYEPYLMELEITQQEDWLCLSGLKNPSTKVSLPTVHHLSV